MNDQSDKIDELAKALVSAQKAIKPAAKDSTNPHFRSKYASLQSVWEAAQPVLIPNGLSVVQTFKETAGDVVTVVTTLLHTSGQWVRSTLTLKPTKADPQGVGSAITYGRRYSLAAILGIVADDDDDGNAASERPQAPREQRPHKPLTKETADKLRFLAGTPKGRQLIDRVLAKHELVGLDDFDEPLGQLTVKWIEDETKKEQPA